MKKEKVLKYLKWGGITVGALLLVVLVAGRLALPHVMKGVIQSAGTEALGQEVSVERVRVSLLRGRVGLQGLRVAAAPGYTANTLFLAEDLSARISYRSLLTSTVLVRSVELGGVRLNLDVDGEGNRSLADFLAGMAKEEPVETVEEEEKEPSVEEPSKPREPRKKGIRLRTLEISDVRVGVHDAFAWEEPIEMVLTLDDFTIRDLHIPPEGISRGETMRLGLKDLTVRASERFSQPILYHLGHFSMELDVPQLLDSMEKPRVHLPSLEYADSFLHLETTERGADKPKPENLQEVLVALKNATGDEPKKLVEIEQEARDKARRESEERRAARREAPSVVDMLAAGIQRRESPREEPTPVETPVVEVEDPGEPAKEPFEFVKLDRLKVTDFNFTSIDQLDESKSATARLVEILGERLVYPPDPSVNSSLTLRSHPLSKDTNFSVKLAGNLGEPADGRSMNLQTTVVRLPLERVKDIERGLLDADITAAVKDRHISGKVKLRADNVRGSGRNTVINLLTTGPVGSVLSHEKGLEIPFSVQLDDPAWRSILQGVLMQIGAQLVEQASRRAQEMALEGVSREVDRVRDQLGTVGNQLESLGEGAGSEVREVIDDVGGALQGLFRRERREREQD